MNTRMMSIALAALLAGAGLAGNVEARDDRHWRGSSSHHGQHHGRSQSQHNHHRNQRQQRHASSYRHGSYRPPAQYRRPVHAPPPAYVHHAPRHRTPTYHRHAYGHRPVRWARGHHLPRHYYGPSYYVDYRPYRLAPPPYGHHWVRVDRDVFLVALATGLIVDTVHGLFR